MKTFKTHLKEIKDGQLVNQDNIARGGKNVEDARGMPGPFPKPRTVKAVIDQETKIDAMNDDAAKAHMTNITDTPQARVNDGHAQFNNLSKKLGISSLNDQ